MSIDDKLYITMLLILNALMGSDIDSTSSALSGPYTETRLRIIENNLARFKEINAVEIQQLKQKHFFSHRVQLNASEVTPLIHQILYRNIALQPNYIVECYQKDSVALVEGFNQFILFLKSKPEYRSFNKYLSGLRKIIEWDMAHPMQKNRKRKRDSSSRK